MDDSAREAAPSGTEEPDAEDNKDRDVDADAAKDGRTSKTTEVLEQFCSRGEKLSKGDGLVAFAQQIVVHPFCLGVPPRF